MSESSTIRTLLGVRHPLLSAPMAGVGGGQLAAAVSRAGGLGLIGGGYGDPRWLHDELRHCQGSRFGVGFITWALTPQPALLDRALDAGASAIMLSFGPIESFVPRIHAAGALCIAQVQTVAQARLAEQAGADVLVAQGGEGGGHSGQRGTMALVPAVVDAVALPVIAAGGIADHRGYRAAFALGAQGVLCGTAFHAAHEALAHPRAKAALLAASGDDTAKSALFDTLRALDWPMGPWGLRTLRNRFLANWLERPPGPGADIAALRAEFEAARERGDFSIAPVIAGEAVDLVTALRPAAEIVAAIVSGQG